MSVRKILCPVDFHPASQRAFDYAVTLGRQYGASIHVLHVITLQLAASYGHENTGFLPNIQAEALARFEKEVVPSLEEEASQQLRDMARNAESEGVTTTTGVAVGEVEDEVQAAVRNTEADLLLMGTHGRRSARRWFLGSTTERILRASPVPVMTTSAAGPQPPDVIRRIVVPVDLADSERPAIRYALSLRTSDEQSLAVLHVVRDQSLRLDARYRGPLMRGIKAELHDIVVEEAGNREIEVAVEHGVPYQGTLDFARQRAADLVVMNIKGKGFIDRVVLGSTAERLVRAAPCPIVAVPRGDAAKSR